MVRRIVLGDGARDDHEVTDTLARLRAHANWAGLRPRRPDLRARFLTRIQQYVARAEPGSLAELIASVPAPDEVDRVWQFPQWLFAFDAAVMAARWPYANGRTSGANTRRRGSSSITGEEGAKCALSVASVPGRSSTSSCDRHRRTRV